jgi:hypothetical protein
MTRVKEIVGDTRVPRRECETSDRVKSIFTETLVKRLPYKKILDLKTISIKVKRIDIITAESLYKKKI